MITRCMIDIETLGRKAGCVITSIGAVKFNLDGLADSPFYCRIDIADACERLGLRMDADTVMWWMRQNEAARMEIAAQPGVQLDAVLGQFTSWLGEVDEVWCKGASFDFPILKEAFDRVGVEMPWKYYQERCARTLMALDPPATKGVVSHRADDDAIAQANEVIRILRRVRTSN
jgi:DNA polymerase III epsilon subunit-like protein